MLTKTIQTLQNSIDSMARDIKSQSEELAEIKLIMKEVQKIKDENKVLKQQLVELKVKFDTIETKQTSTDPVEVMNFVANETNDRQSRKNNFIIYNSTELRNGTKEEQYAADRAIVIDILKSLNFQEEAISVTRLGKFDSSAVSKKRPIKVKLLSDTNISAIIRNFNTLKINESFKDLSVSPDRTPFQCNLYKKVKNDLLERKRNGESNITIKHINGIPKIVMTRPTSVNTDPLPNAQKN